MLFGSASLEVGGKYLNGDTLGLHLMYGDLQPVENALPSAPLRLLLSGRAIQAALNNAPKHLSEEMGNLADALIQAGGTDAIKGLGIASSFGPGGVTDQFMLLTDKSPQKKDALTNIIAEPTSFTPAATAFAPSDTTGVISFGVDPVRVYDNLLVGLVPC